MGRLFKEDNALRRKVHQKKIFSPETQEPTEQSQLIYEILYPSRIWSGQSTGDARSKDMEYIYSKFLNDRVKQAGQSVVEKFMPALDWSMRQLHKGAENCTVNCCRTPPNEGFISCPLPEEQCDFKRLGAWMITYYVANKWKFGEEEATICDSIQRLHSKVVGATI